MKKLSKSAQKVAEYEKTLLAKVTRYSVHLQISPLEVMKADCATLDEARIKEREFNQQSAYGRRASVYGITPDGRSVHL